MNHRFGDQIRKTSTTFGSRQHCNFTVNLSQRETLRSEKIAWKFVVVVTVIFSCSLLHLGRSLNFVKICLLLCQLHAYVACFCEVILDLKMNFLQIYDTWPFFFTINFRSSCPVMLFSSTEIMIIVNFKFHWKQARLVFSFPSHFCNQYRLPVLKC